MLCQFLEKNRKSWLNSKYRYFWAVGKLTDRFARGLVPFPNAEQFRVINDTWCCLYVPNHSNPSSLPSATVSLDCTKTLVLQQRRGGNPNMELRGD